MAPQDDSPAGLFRALYSVATWATLGLMIIIVAALIGLLFVRTPAGTAQSQELALVRPTQTALAAAYVGEESEGGVVRVVELPVTCAACHAIEGTSAAGKVCPDLTHVGGRAAERLADPSYTGSATTADEYIRESILKPNAFVVQGEGYVAANGASTMPEAVGQSLTPTELDNLVAYLASLK